jgi:DNA polymerase I
MKSPPLAMLGHWYRRVWLIDFEFTQPEGERPTPICMVARCAISGETVRLWGSELALCPFSCDETELFVAYYAIAEASCFFALGWPRVKRMLDLCAEFRRLTNGVRPLFSGSLIGALKYFGLPDIGGEEKTQMRDLAIRGGPYSAGERLSLLAYCESDVLALARLLGPLCCAAGLTDFSTLVSVVR